MIPLFLAGGVFLVGIIWAISTHNRLVGIRNQVAESWSGIDTELKRRYNLIPNLVETVKGYAAHEQKTLQRVTAARSTAAASDGSPASQARDENALVGSLRQLFAVVEGYPDLKASSSFLNLQKELANTEDRIQAARRFYNGNVRDLNNLVQMFPSSLVANAFSFAPGEYFEVESAVVRDAVPVKLT